MVSRFQVSLAHEQLEIAEAAGGRSNDRQNSTDVGAAYRRRLSPLEVCSMNGDPVSLPEDDRNNYMEVKDMRSAQRLSALAYDALSEADRQHALSLLVTFYRAYNKLATCLAFANGRIEQLQEQLRAAEHELGMATEAEEDSYASNDMNIPKAGRDL